MQVKHSWPNYEFEMSKTEVNGILTLLLYTIVQERSAEKLYDLKLNFCPGSFQWTPTSQTCVLSHTMYTHLLLWTLWGMQIPVWEPCASISYSHLNSNSHTHFWVFKKKATPLTSLVTRHTKIKGSEWPHAYRCEALSIQCLRGIWIFTHISLL